MALKRVYSTAAEIPEAVKALYEEQGGRYVLALDEGEDDAAGLKSALRKEREAREVSERTLRALQKQTDGLDPAKAREALAKLQELEDAKLQQEKGAEELLKKRTEAMQADAAAQREASAKLLKEAETARDAAAAKLAELVVDGALRDAAFRAHVRPALVPALIRAARAGDIEGIRWDLKDGAPVPFAGETLKYGKDPSKPMGPDEYLALVAAKIPDYFESSAGAGATGSGGRASGTFTLTPEQAKNPQAYRAAKAAAEKAGQSVSIAP